MQNAPFSDVLCSQGGLRIFCVMFFGHIVLVLLRASLFTMAWCVLGFLIYLWRLLYRIHSESRVLAFVGSQKEKTRGRSSIVDVLFNVQAVLAMYNLKYHRGAPGGGDAGLQPPNSKFQKHLL